MKTDKAKKQEESKKLSGEKIAEVINSLNLICSVQGH
jgi:hypothetical protein